MEIFRYGEQCYTQAMSNPAQSTPPLQSSGKETPAVVLVRNLKAIAVCLAAWFILCCIGALTGYGDALSKQKNISYLSFLWSWIQGAVFLTTMSCGLYLFFQRYRAAMLRSKNIVLLYLFLTVFFMPLDIAYEAMLTAVEMNKEISWNNVFIQIKESSRFYWFVDLIVLSVAYTVQVALNFWQHGRAHERKLQQVQTDNLRLELELEQQRLYLLRGQLEPHFMFNALNAISALVRGNDKKLALNGIFRLSQLLRYALESSERDWVCIQQEWQFIVDYLALQSLRYGERLQLHLDAPDENIASIACPPFILQPLVENVLRHDVDCHTESTDMRIAWQILETSLIVTISNPMPDVPANPGTGLGLRQTRARLQHAYAAMLLRNTANNHLNDTASITETNTETNTQTITDEALAAHTMAAKRSIELASLKTEVRDGRFIAQLQIPILRMNRDGQVQT